jgi:hypothetical protein
VDGHEERTWICGAKRATWSPLPGCAKHATREELEMMDSKALFNELLHRLCKYEDCKYSDEMLLHYLLRQGADEAEFKTTSVKLALDALSGCLNRWEVQRSADRLSKLGLISTRVHANTRTHFLVNRQTVLALLAKPLARNLPGIDERHFSFLDAWQSQRLSAASDDAADNPQILLQEANQTESLSNN